MPFKKIPKTEVEHLHERINSLEEQLARAKSRHRPTVPIYNSATGFPVDAVEGQMAIDDTSLPFAPSGFVIAGLTSAHAPFAASLNGISWGIINPAPTDPDLLAGGYGSAISKTCGKISMAFGFPYCDIYDSDDMRSWTQSFHTDSSTLPEYAEISGFLDLDATHALAYGAFRNSPSKLIATGHLSGGVITWTPSSAISVAAGSSAIGAAYSPTLGRIVLSTNISRNIYTSDDFGVTWTGHSTGSILATTNGIWETITWIGDKFLAVGVYSTGPTLVTKIATSTDGITWTGAASPFSSTDFNGGGSAWYSDALDICMITAVKFTGETEVAMTSDGVSFTTASAGITQCIGVASDDNLWMICSINGTPTPVAQISNDNGITWSDISTPMDGGQVSSAGSNVLSYVVP